jgi:YD repeat-containing protein
MVRNAVAALFVLSILLCALSSPASAQTNSSCFGFVGQYCAACGDRFPPGWFGCFTEGPFLSICMAMGSNCVPAAAPPETRCPCGSTAGHPIALDSGNTYVQWADVKVPGLSGGLKLLRTWNSMWPSTQSALQVGLFGPNWRSTFEERIFVGSDNYIKYARGDGSFWSFGYGTSAQLTVAAPANVSASLVYGPTYWTLTFQNGEQRLFNESTGNLVAIIDRNGNTTQLSYDAIGRLVTVTDPASRQLYFSYASQTSYLVTGITSNIGISVSYSYDTQGRLSQVTEPDLSTQTYQYDNNSMISSVLDSNGNVLEAHTYDSLGRGLTSTRANGVDSITLTYPNN